MKQGLFLTSLVLLLDSELPAGDFTPLPQQADMRVGALDVKPMRVHIPMRSGWGVGHQWISCGATELVATGAKDGQVKWRSTLPNAEGLRLLSTGNGELLLLSAQGAGDGPVIYRLSLTGGRLLGTLRPPLGMQKGSDVRHAITAAVHTRGGIAVLAITEHYTSRDWRLSSYRVCWFRNGASEPTWLRDFASAPGTVDRGPVLLLTSPSPRRESSELRQFSAAGDHLIICAGPREDIVSLDCQTGKPHWCLKAIWEFERGFVGPSVFQHYISRFGRYPPAEESREAQGKTAEHKSFIVGGPLVVPTEATYRAFVAVARSDSPLGRYLSESVVFEIDCDGNPVAMIPMPRRIIGGQYRVLPKGVLWRCERDAIAMVVPSSQARQLTMGPGDKPDCLGRLEWYRQLFDAGDAEGPSQAWLRTGKSADGTYFDCTMMVRVTGCFIEKQDDRVFRFPVQLADLGSGQVESMLLSIPFQGVVSEPKTNFWGGGGRISAIGPYALEVARLSVQDGTLSISIRTTESRKWSAELIFDLDRLFRQRAEERRIRAASCGEPVIAPAVHRDSDSQVTGDRSDSSAK